MISSRLRLVLLNREVGAPLELSKAVKRQFEYVAGVQSQFDEDRLLAQLPNGLRNEVPNVCLGRAVRAHEA